MAAYRATLEKQGGDISKFDKEVGTNFKKGGQGIQGSQTLKRYPSTELCLCASGRTGLM